MDKHKFKVFVRHEEAGESLSNYVEKVIFQIHPHYKPSLFTVASEPFELTKVYPKVINLSIHPSEIDNSFPFVRPVC